MTQWHPYRILNTWLDGKARKSLDILGKKFNKEKHGWEHEICRSTKRKWTFLLVKFSEALIKFISDQKNYEKTFFFEFWSRFKRTKKHVWYRKIHLYKMRSLQLFLDSFLSLHILSINPENHLKTKVWSRNQHLVETQDPST